MHKINGYNLIVIQYLVTVDGFDFNDSPDCILGKPAKRQKNIIFRDEKWMKTELTHEEKKLIERHKNLLLRIELVPKSSWCSNVRSILKQSQWDKIRKSTYNKAGNKCEICKSTGDRHPDCHEVWVYDNKSMTQRLSRFQAICPACHEVKHLGRAIHRGNGEEAFNRFREFNNLDDLLALRIKNAVFKEWKERSREKWVLDITLLKAYDIDVDDKALRGVTV